MCQFPSGSLVSDHQRWTNPECQAYPPCWLGRSGPLEVRYEYVTGFCIGWMNDFPGVLLEPVLLSDPVGRAMSKDRQENGCFDNAIFAHAQLVANARLC